MFKRKTGPENEWKELSFGIPRKPGMKLDLVNTKVSFGSQEFESR
jgi:hypothetical protein